MALLYGAILLAYWALTNEQGLEGLDYLWYALLTMYSSAIVVLVSSIIAIICNSRKRKTMRLIVVLSFMVLVFLAIIMKKTLGY